MEPSLRDEIKDRLSRYLAGQDELSAFHEWFIPATWDIDSQSEPVKRVAHRLQLLLAEFSNGDWSEEELRTKFWELINRSSITVTVGDPPLAIPPTSVTQTVPGNPAATRSVG